MEACKTCVKEKKYDPVISKEDGDLTLKDDFTHVLRFAKDSRRNLSPENVADGFNRMNYNNLAFLVSELQMIHGNQYVQRVFDSQTFKNGQYTPSIELGRWLSTHESIHVVKGVQNNLIRRKKDERNESNPILLEEGIKYVGNLKEVVIDKIKSRLITEIVIIGLTKILRIFNPVSGIITIIKILYKVVKSLIEQVSRIMTLFDILTDLIVDLTMGVVNKPTNKVEETLARLVPLVIGFIAKFLNIGDLTTKKFKRVQNTVHKAIDKMILKFVIGITKLLPGKKGKKEKTDYSP